MTAASMVAPGSEVFVAVRGLLAENGASLLAALVAARVAGVCALQPDLTSFELLISNENT